MKNLIKIFLPVLVLGMFSCKNAPKEGSLEAGTAKKGVSLTPSGEAATTYNVDASQSVISWTGSKVLGDRHTGTLKLAKGSISSVGGKLTGGTFVIDMNSLSNSDLGAGSGKEKLEGHLKSADFFDTVKFPNATFTITEVNAVGGGGAETHKITGNLTMMGMSKSISIPANVSMGADKIMAVSPAFSINRTDWGVKYGSGLLGTVKDKAISDDVSISLKISAAKS